ncbi:MAG: hypothetical protein M3437_08520 [Chloroflexota bacterium]|nr:hypothetical protein [Chloroflexota bacterium]MDQ5867218.1 hypothetical protein [Chloroflexota bacterium]
MHGQTEPAYRSSENEVSLVARYAAAALAVIAGLEWLLGRTISRLAAAPTLEGTPRDVVESVGRVGLYLISPTAILALSVLLLLVMQTGAEAIRTRDASRLAVTLFLAIFGLVGLVHTFYPTLLWLNVTLNLLTFIALWWVAVACLVARERSTSMRVGVVLVALAYSGWLYYVVQQDLTDVGASLLGAPLLFLNLGEIAAVCAPAAFFWAIALPDGQWRHPVRWVFPAILVLVFSAGNVADALLNQGFMGVFAIWSLGMNLFLPWPLYAISGGLFVYSVLTCFTGRGRRSREANPSTGLGLLLLVFAGYALQLPFQFIMAVLSIALLSRLVRVPSRRALGRSAVVSKQVESGSQQPASATSGPSGSTL